MLRPLFLFTKLNLLNSHIQCVTLFDYDQTHWFLDWKFSKKENPFKTRLKGEKNFQIEFTWSRDITKIEKYIFPISSLPQSCRLPFFLSLQKKLKPHVAKNKVKKEISQRSPLRYVCGKSPSTEIWIQIVFSNVNNSLPFSFQSLSESFAFRTLLNFSFWSKKKRQVSRVAWEKEIKKWRNSPLRYCRRYLNTLI